jgi:hypothetical protein
MSKCTSLCSDETLIVDISPLSDSWLSVADGSRHLPILAGRMRFVGVSETTLRGTTSGEHSQKIRRANVDRFFGLRARTLHEVQDQYRLLRHRGN